MQQIISFFIKNKNFLLFAFLFFIAIATTLQSHTYHNSKWVSSTNFFSGGLYSLKSSVTDYFSLKEQNQQLIEENSRLRTRFENTKISEIPPLKITKHAGFKFIGASVIKNAYSKTNNQITINKGKRDSLTVDMGVITSKGVVGIINKVSNKYARIQSILNSNSQINAQLKKTNHFGFLVWNGDNPNITQLIEIPKLAPITVGDTIITGGNSAIFPKGILIGTIKDYKINNEDTYTINVQLFNDMTNLTHVYAIKNPNKKEIVQLEVIEDDK